MPKRNKEDMLMKAKTKFTKLWSILLALAMVVGMLPIAALAAGSATGTADFTVGDGTAALTLLNAAKTGDTDSTWDGDTSTLTLNGVNFTTTAATAVKLPDGAKITLADGTTNTIKGGDAATGDCYGIYGEGSLTIQGTGTLNVTSGTAGNLSFGIHAQNSVTINSGAVTATGGAAPGNQSLGIRALNGNLTINGGTVTSTGSDAKNSSNGLWAGNGNMVIRGGEVEAESGRVMGVGASSGIYAKNVEINNTGTIVTATGGTAQHGTSYGINAVSGGTVTFSGGTLTAATKGDSCINGTFNAAGKTISFDSNDGVGNMMARTTATEYTLPANGFTPPAGMQLKGWSVNGTEKAVGDTITVTADTTVKAVWEDIPAAPADYDILNGANSKWTQDSDGNISVRGSGEFSKFVGVKVDGKTVDEKYYTVKEGSTIVTLKPEYLNTLTAGKHTLEIVWTDGTADTTFTVDAKPANTDTKSPQTADNSSIALWIALLFVFAAGVLSTAVLGKKKKRSAK